MSDTNENANHDNGPLVTEPINDLYLRMLIAVLEGDETNQSSLSITLSTYGGVVYGHLITKDAWKSLWAKQMEDATASDTLKRFPDTVDSSIDQLLEEHGSERPDGGLRYFLHLKDATILAPGSAPIQVPFWRGRVDSVAGWSLGAPA